MNTNANNFNMFEIDQKIISALRKIGIKEPTEIQKKAIPRILSDNDVIVESNTGTGKTMSFLIPIINKILYGSTSSSVILAPTRELVIQIYSEISKLFDILTKASDENNIMEASLDIISIYGGRDINSQISKLKSQNKRIIIATPGRLIDHINRKTIDISKTDSFVVDEADQMLLMGFRNEIDFIFSNIKSKKQILLFSATIDSKVKKMAYRYSDSFFTIRVDGKDVPSTIKQKFVFTTDRNKFYDFCKTIENDPPFMAIVFCRTKARVDNLELKMAQIGYKCEKIHSDLSQSKRERIMKDFRNLKIQFLISTDLSSRGLDVEGITHIYNYDFPERVEDYIHRIGRTGRIGKEGISYSFITEKNQNIYDEVCNHLNK
ncbi:DEAD/DEAH box helicase [Peptostreptococcus sp. D1]|uniref:DEAD/DEAH box helicase n=1 Tax=Peptostreptococcus sp. D1 TaxID=72304 RepID=UPI0008E2E841|nr:DEAD/DEAH box helicase [Peptostreptococcus sp. D1]SFE32700.1 Helicase conserved C-terminal domain-containing protein [Peptostreptococcus sp. D1]